MRRALRRLGSVLLTLIATSLVAAWALSVLSSRLAPSQRPLPTFFNPAPRNARVLAGVAVEELARGRDVEPAARELHRLGGAALPHVLGHLDALAPAARGRVAIALAPVAVRMGLASPGEFATPQAAVLFWTRFWQDRAMDFRPELVRRLVGRLAHKSSVLRNEDVIQLDTYALPELIDALTPAQDAAGVARARRLSLVLAHVTEKPWIVRESAEPSEANRQIARWREFWLDSGADFTSPEGARQVIAHLAETRYGHWIRGFGLPGERGRFAIGLEQALRSLVHLLGAALVAFGVSAALVSGGLRRETWRRALGSRALAVLGASVPAAIWLSAFGALGRNALASAGVIVLAGVGGGAALAVIGVRALARDEYPSRGAALAHGALVFPALLPWLFTSLVVLELGFGLDTAAFAAVQALRDGELRGAMSFALAAALLAALIRGSAPRWAAYAAPASAAPALVEVGGRRSRRARWLWLALVGAALAIALVSLARPVEGTAPLVRLARAFVLYATLTTAVAAAVGLGVGALRARRHRSLDSILARAIEVQAALPAAVWAAALAAVLGGGVWLALALGLLRALDVAWVYRSEVARSEPEALAFAERRSLGVTGRVTPVPMSSRSRAAATGPALAVLALTPAWALALDAAAAWFGLSPDRPGLGLLSLRLGESGTLALATPLAAALAGAAALAWLAPLPRKLGAVRPSRPPPLRRSPSDPPPSSERLAALDDEDG